MTIFFLLLVSLFAVKISAIGPSLKIWTYPENAKDVTTVSSPGAALIGGGKDCDPAFAYLANNANGGDFLVIRASGKRKYYFFIVIKDHI